jgi:hypothetical protein
MIISPVDLSVLLFLILQIYKQSYKKVYIVFLTNDYQNYVRLKTKSD